MMKKIPLLLLCVGAIACAPKPQKTLKEAFKDRFHIGTAMNTAQIEGTDTRSVELIRRQFDAIVAENCMKSMYIQPQEGVFFFDEADKLVEFGEANGMFITGHCLIWHTQAPPWFFVDADGNDVSREVLLSRMESHIKTLVGRYKGRIKGWDVVNEAIEDDGSWRQSKFFTIIGEDYIKYAFQWAHEADPDCELYYNDFSMAHAGKRDAVVAMVEKLRAEGVRIDGIGMQGHLSMNWPSPEAFEQSLVAFAATGLKVMVTELDLTVLPTPATIGADASQHIDYQAAMNPYADSLPAAVSEAWDARMTDFFRIFVKHADKLDRVTFWGVTDNDSWKNDWPIRGRTDYALLFDRDYQPKPAFFQIIEN